MRLTIVGPIPPPMMGQAWVTCRMVSELKSNFDVRLANTAEMSGWKGIAVLRPPLKLLQTAAACLKMPGSDFIYVAVKADHGMWLTCAAALVARLTGAEVFLHHHSYNYICQRKLRMVALSRIAGPRAQHIVLSRAMAADLHRTMPEISQPFIVIGNAPFIDQSLLELPVKSDRGELVLGHLGLLSRQKGIGEVVDLAVALQDRGSRVRLIIGGPLMDEEATRSLDRASRILGDRFEYWGFVGQDIKRTFFERVTHFVLPSRIDAVPLVLFEAMAAGVVCVTTRQGAIAEQIGDSGGILASSADTFVAEALPQLLNAEVSSDASKRSRDVYMRSLAEAQQQLADFLALLEAPKVVERPSNRLSP